MAAVNKKRKFNFIDFLIILIVVAIIGAAAYLVGAKKMFAGDAYSLDVEYVVEFRQVRDEFLDCFTTGVEAVDAAKKYRLGEVIGVESTASIYTGNDLVNGKLVYSNYPEHSDVRLTIRSTAKLDAKGMYILDGGYRISVGSVVYVRTPGFTGTAYCIRINQADA